MIRSIIPSKIVRSVRGFQHAIKVGLIRSSLIAFKNTHECAVIGTDYGGWPVPLSVLDKGGSAVCCGCGTDISFDLGLVYLYKFHVVAFDPTPNSVNYVNELIDKGAAVSFVEKGVYSRNTTLEFYEPSYSFDDSYSASNIQETSKSIQFEVVRLSDVFKDMGTVPSILKMDIEGVETKVLNEVLDSEFRPTCILVEFDELAYPTTWSLKKIRFICRKLLRKGYRLYSISGSNFCFIHEL